MEPVQFDLPVLPEQQPSEKKRKPWRKWIVLGLAAVFFAVAAIVLYRTVFASNADTPSVTTTEFTVTVGDVRAELAADGTVSLPLAFLNFPRKAELLELFVNTGDSFKQGDVLAIQNDDELQDAVSAAESSLQNAEDGLRNAEINLEKANQSYSSAVSSASDSRKNTQDSRRQQELTIQNQKNTIREAEDTLAALRKDLQTMEILAEEYAASELETKRSDIQSQEQRIVTEKDKLALYEAQLASITDSSSADTNIASAQLNVETAQYEIISAQSTLEQAKEKLAEAIADLEQAKLLAPCNGTVIAVNGEVGYSVGEVGEPSVATSLIVYLPEGQPMTVNAAIPELDVKDVAVGQKVEVVIDAWDEQPLQGVVSEISTLATSSGGVVSYAAVITLGEVQQGIRNEMNCTMTIIQEEALGVLTLPSSAILRSPRGSMVLKQNAEGVQERVEVQTGLSDGTTTEIISGLSEGDVVLSISRTAEPERDDNTERGMAMPAMVDRVVVMPGGAGGMSGPPPMIQGG